jgi:hypothetical protein
MLLLGILPAGPSQVSSTPAPAESGRDDIDRRLARLEKIVAAGAAKPAAPGRKKTP